MRVGETRPGARHRRVVQLVQVRRVVARRRVELPVVVAVPAVLGPRGRHLLAGRLHRVRVVLLRGQVLQEPTERQGGWPEPRGQARGVQLVGLVAERPPQPVQRAEQVLGLAAVVRRLPRSVVDLAHVTDARWTSGRSPSAGAFSSPGRGVEEHVAHLGELLADPPLHLVGGLLELLGAEVAGEVDASRDQHLVRGQPHGEQLQHAVDTVGAADQVRDAALHLHRDGLADQVLGVLAPSP